MCTENVVLVLLPIHPRQSGGDVDHIHTYCMPTNHPVLAGGIAGSIEICITFPIEYVKTQVRTTIISATNKLLCHSPMLTVAMDTGVWSSCVGSSSSSRRRRPCLLAPIGTSQPGTVPQPQSAEMGFWAGIGAARHGYSSPARAQPSALGRLRLYQAHHSVAGSQTVSASPQWTW